MQNKQVKTSMKGSRWWGVLIFLVLVFIDQLTKLLTVVYFGEDTYTKVELIPNLIWWCLSYNSGIAFSMLGGADGMVKIIVIAVTAVMMVALSVLYFRLDKRRAWLRNALVFIVAGGVGNLIDRIYYQIWIPSGYGVRDMVDLSVFGFGVCNFADFFIVGGAIALFFALFFFDKDALFPIGKKYKTLAKEAQEETERKQAKKQAKKHG